MMRRLAKYLVGKRVEGDTHYYRRLRHVERKLKELVATAIMAIVVVAMIILVFIGWGKAGSNGGHYEPDMVVDGVLYDTDGDGDYYHWVEDQEVIL